MLKDRSALGRTTPILLAAGLLGLLAIAAASLWMAERDAALSARVAEAQALRVAALDVRNQLQDAETGQRGYLLTGDPAYRAPYDAAHRHLPQALTTLLAASTPDPVLHRLSEGIAAVARAKMAELTRTVTLAEAGNLHAALDVLRQGSGKALMDQARDLLDQALTRIDARVQGSSRLLSGSRALLLGLTAFGVLLIVAVAVIAILVVGRSTRALNRAHDLLATANLGLEARVRERTAALEQANEEVQRFAYIVSHDLRAPLVNVMGFTAELEIGLASVQALVETVEVEAPELVSREARDAVREDVPEAIGFIRSSTDRMDRLINAILRISREGRRMLAPERVAMGELFAQLAPTVRHQLEVANGELVIEQPLPDLVADRLALEQIFGNLIDNAVKYLDPARPGRIVIRGRRAGDAAIFEVEDNGRGIPQEDYERIFELFRRSGAQDRPGEGIGLAHVRAVLRRINGSISCESRVGVGSLFRITLPLAPVRAAKEATA